MKKLLVLGAGFLQSFLIKKSRELGYYTIALDKDNEAVGFKYANEFAVIDIVDQEQCLEFARLNNIDGVITAATDYGVLTAAYIAKELMLPGLDYEVAKLIKNKFLVRKKISNQNADHMENFFIIEQNTNLNELTRQIKYPMIIKPVDGSGSKGVHKISSYNDLQSYSTEAISFSKQKLAYLEEFIEGKEYGVESVVYNGIIYVLCIMNKDMTEPPIYAELGHSVPSDLENESLVVDVVKKTIKTLGINFGAVNMDVLIKDNNVFVIDIGARMGGNLIGSHIVPLHTGFDYMEYLIKTSLNEDVSKMFPESNDINKAVSTRILALKPGIIKDTIDFEELEKEFNVKIFFNKSIGDKIYPYINNLDGCGYIICVSSNKQNAYDISSKVKSIIDDQIIREKDFL